MEEIFHLCCPSKPRFFYCSRPPQFFSSSSSHKAPTRLRLLILPRRRSLNSSSSSSSHYPRNSSISLPKKPSKTAPSNNNHHPPPSKIPNLPPPDPHSPFREKMLYLDSIGIDLLSLSAAHPPLISASLSDIRSTVDFLRSAGGFTSHDIRRICGMCPEVLTAGGPSALSPVFTFLLREAGVDGIPGLRRAVNRRPRLLVSDVSARLRPTLYFLQMLGIADTARHAPLLSCSVEGKLLPRIEFLQGVGFSPREARAMVRRFPQLFCYSIGGNLEPKFDFFAVGMGRDLRELKEFPQYFSFSLRDRIRPRHRRCAEAGVRLPLPAMLKPGDEQFGVRLEVCVSSSAPLKDSPLWHDNLDSSGRLCNHC